MSRPSDDRRAGSHVLADDVYEAEIGDREPSEAVVDVVSALLDREPTALSPLYRTVDPEALDGLCDPDASDARPTVRFHYEGLIVTVSPPDVITVAVP